MSPRCFLPSFKSISLSVQEKKGKKDFRDGRHGHLGFPIGTILAIFDLQVTRCFLLNFNRIFGSGEEAKNRFLRWSPWRPCWISDLNDFSLIDLQVKPMPPTKFQINWPFGSGAEA